MSGGGGPVGRALLLVPLLLGGLALLLQVNGGGRERALSTRSLSLSRGLHHFSLFSQNTQWTATAPPTAAGPSLVAGMDRLV